MVATDVASRGLDISNVTHVINFDLPSNIEDYIHRVGRTGRVGKMGTAISFVDAVNKPVLSKLLNLLIESAQIVPKWFQDMVDNIFEEKQSRYYDKRGNNGYGNNSRNGGRFDGFSQNVISRNYYGSGGGYNNPSNNGNQNGYNNNNDYGEDYGDDYGDGYDYQ